MSTLIICEKNDAAHKIANILSNGNVNRRSLAKVPIYDFQRKSEKFSVIGLRGHIIELDFPEECSKWKGTDLKKLIWLTPVKKTIAENIVSTLRILSTQNEKVIVATDYDREGELIGVEALEIIKSHNPAIKTKRVRFSSFTSFEIESAFENLAEIDDKLATSAETRQVIDLVWGSVLTRFISLASGQMGSSFLSVGRVQSPTLALLVDREREIKDFVPEPYWVMEAEVEKGEIFLAIHSHGKFWVKEEAEKVMARIRTKKEAVVEKLERKEVADRPPSPFNTTSFLAECSKLGFGAAQSMKIAENLYMRGYISYPRTDNTVYPPSLNLRNALSRLANSEFGKEVNELLQQEKLRATRGKVMATDHPPIYPVDSASRREIDKNHWSVYELVVRRFLATLAPDAKVIEIDVEIKIGVDKFLAKGLCVLDWGWRKYYPYYRLVEISLPDMKVGDRLHVLSYSIREERTKPPARYTQGSLIQAMERLELGTKSTRHEIIQKLYERKYVQGPNLIPTNSGMAVISALEDHAHIVTKPEMTATLEEDMTAIAEGTKEKMDVVCKSQGMLEDVLTILQRNADKIGKEINEALKIQNYIGECRKCGANLTIRRSREGRRFAGCENYPSCDAIFDLPQSGLLVATDKACDHCGAPIITVINKERGAETHCLDRKCPTVKRIRHVGKCTTCSGDLGIIESKRGKRFIGCSNYPKCTTTFPLPQRGKIVVTEKKCPECGAPVVRVYAKGRGTWDLCINTDCKSKNNKRDKQNRKQSRKTKEQTGPKKEDPAHEGEVS